MAELKRLNYVICRFVVDPLRDEALNVGVIAVSDEDGVSAGAFNLRFKSRFDALGSTADYRVIRKAVENLRDRTGSAYQAGLAEGIADHIRQTEQLRFLAGNLRNQIQVTEPKPFRSESVEAGASELYGLFVSPQRKPAPLGAATLMNIDQLRRLIRETIRHWGGNAISVQEKTLERANNTRHLADFWLEAGSPVAAFVAIPEDPGDRFEAWARRDSIPTIAEAFQVSNPNFKAIAVLPPNGHKPTEFVKETRDFLGTRNGVLVLHADQLEEHRREILAQGL